MVDSTPTGVGAAVDDQIDAAAHVGEHMLREWSARHGRSGLPTAPPPAGRSDARIFCATACAGTRTAMLSRPAVASSATVQPAALGSTSVSGPGQNAGGEPRRIGIEARQLARRREIDHMRDQRIERRPALGRVEPRHRRAIGGVGAEPVNGLGGEGDKPAGRETRAPHPRSRRRRRRRRVSTIGAVIAELSA